MRLLRIEGARAGRGGRVYVGRVRLHHGAVGVALLAGGLVLGGPLGVVVSLAGGVLVFHDRRDAPWCFDA